MNIRKKILVIDDDPLFRNLMTTILGKEFQVEVAHEGSEGFHQAVNNPPDVAIVDLQMPGWHGLRTLKALKSHPALSELKVVIMTSDSTRKMVLEAIKEGANDYIIKTSFQREDFLRKLKRLLPNWEPATHECKHLLANNSRVNPVPTHNASKTSSRESASEQTTSIDDLDRQTFDDDKIEKGNPTEPTVLVSANSETPDAQMRALIDNWE